MGRVAGRGPRGLAALRCPPHGALPVALTPAALLGEPPVAGGTLSALEPPGPWQAVALSSLGVALRALGGWSTGARVATPAALEAEVSFLQAQVWSQPCPALKTRLPPLLQP